MYESSERVEPIESTLSESPVGTVFITSSIARIMIGKMNSATVIIPAKSEVLTPKNTISEKPKAP